GCPQATPSPSPNSPRDQSSAPHPTVPRHQRIHLQAGPRLHLGERLDLDLLVGGHLRGERERWLVSGATLRF
ncbi:hypothetical protein ACLXBB_26700, partial [Pseudomonas aeruginosa]